MSDPVIVLASRNPGKLTELRQILAGRIAGLDVQTQVIDAAAAGVPEIAETGIGFAENSLLKARAVAEHTGLIGVADDSGLCVDVLGGAPGFLSARWSGEHGQDQENLELLLAQLSEIPDQHRTAHFECAASAALPPHADAEDADASEVVCTGRMPGRLAREPRGSGGFGYDPIFLPDELTGKFEGCSAAEVPGAVKNAISHRGRAFEALVPELRRLLAMVRGDAAAEGRE